MRQLPRELIQIDCPELRTAITHTGIFAAASWNIDVEDAIEEVIARLQANRVSRKSLVSARRYLREIPEQDFEES